MTKVVLLQMIGAVLLFAAWQQGWVLPIFEQDATGLTWLIAGAFILGLLLLPDGNLFGLTPDWIAKRLVEVGLLGTIIGFSISVSAVSGEANIAMRDLGVASALGTTMAGLICSLWIRLCRRLLG